MRERGVDEKAHLGVNRAELDLACGERRDLVICDVSIRDMIWNVGDGHMMVSRK